MALPLHSDRASVVDEAEAVLELGRDDYVRVYEQMSVYLRTRPASLEENPHWTGILARRRAPVVREAMQDWWEQLLRFPRVEQRDLAQDALHDELTARGTGSST